MRSFLWIFLFALYATQIACIPPPPPRQNPPSRDSANAAPKPEPSMQQAGNTSAQRHSSAQKEN